MAVTSNIRGRFVAFKVKTWKAFTDQDGKPVEGGRSAQVWVYTDDEDEPVVVLKVRGDQVDRAVAELEKLTFGVEVEGEVGVTKYAYNYVTLAAARKAA